MTPPTLLLDRSYLVALVASDHPAHHTIRSHYLTVVDQYRLNRLRPMALTDDLACVDGAARAGVLAPVETFHVAAQHRRAAAAVTAHVDPAVALVLVIARREKIRRLATLDPVYQGFDIDLEPLIVANGESVAQSLAN